MYSALYCARRGQSVTVLEIDDAPFSRATYVNQARLHMGYHYPRSLSTAMKSAGYFRRFAEDYSFCVFSEFQQVYATSRHFSWTDAAEFQKFCRDAGIPCEPLPVERNPAAGEAPFRFAPRAVRFPRDHEFFEVRDNPGGRCPEPHREGPRSKTVAVGGACGDRTCGPDQGAGHSSMGWGVAPSCRAWLRCRSPPTALDACLL